MLPREGTETILSTTFWFVYKRLITHVTSRGDGNNLVDYHYYLV